MKTNKFTQDTLTLLLSGRHKFAKKYEGKHVIVVGDEVVPLQRGKAGIEEIERLEKKYGKPTTLVFVPRRDISYILIICK